jgi:hypothetical protein
VRLSFLVVLFPSPISSFLHLDADLGPLPPTGGDSEDRLEGRGRQGAGPSCFFPFFSPLSSSYSLPFLALRTTLTVMTDRSGRWQPARRPRRAALMQLPSPLSLNTRRSLRPSLCSSLFSLALFSVLILTSPQHPPIPPACQVDLRGTSCRPDRQRRESRDERDQGTVRSASFPLFLARPRDSPPSVPSLFTSFRLLCHLTLRSLLAYAPLNPTFLPAARPSPPPTLPHLSRRLATAEMISRGGSRSSSSVERSSVTLVSPLHTLSSRRD